MKYVTYVGVMQMMSATIRDKVEQKFYEMQEKRIELSTDLAEKEHHENCQYECCGEHNDFQDFKKCPKCGMTEEIQQKHNEEWWGCVDEIESSDDECSKYTKAEYLLGEWLDKNP